MSVNQFDVQRQGLFIWGRWCVKGTFEILILVKMAGRWVASRDGTLGMKMDYGMAAKSVAG